MKSNEAKDALSRNLKRILDDKGMNIPELAKKLGMERQSVYYWTVKKTYPTSDTLERMAKVLNVSIDDLTGIESGYASFGSVLNKIKPKSTKTSSVVLRLGTVHATSPEQTTESEQTVEMPAWLLEKYPNAFALRVEGQCMNRAIPDGCDVLVNPTPEARDGAIVIVRVEETNEYAMRRLRKGNSNSMHLLVADSTEHYDDLIFTSDETVSLVGVVVWMQKNLEQE